MREAVKVELLLVFDPLLWATGVLSATAPVGAKPMLRMGDPDVDPMAYPGEKWWECEGGTGEMR
jgi:hypothetical protein